MSLLDVLRSATPADFDRDVIEMFGLKPGDRFAVTAAGLTAGDETVSLADARRAIGLDEDGDVPPARVVIADLEPPRGP